MLSYLAGFVNQNGAAFPNTLAINASGPSTTDGTEFISDMINDSMWGVMQMILNRAGLTPNGVLESDSASQIKEALQKGFGGAPGTIEQWALASDPGVTGHRCLLLNGQGILRANYADLDAAVYVGDGNNAAVAAGGGFFYRADDAAGTIPNIAGVYLILPETRGYVPRGLDLAASVDPLGAARFLGDAQADALQRISGVFTSGSLRFDQRGLETGVFTTVTQAPTVGVGAAAISFATQVQFDSVLSVSPNPVKSDQVETRGANYSTKFVIWY